MGRLTLGQEDTHPTPASGKMTIFFKTDETVWVKDDAGVETQLATTANAGTMPITAGRNSEVTNVYLRGPGNVPMNQAGIVLPWDMTIIAISAATVGSESWTAQVRKNDSATVIASTVLTTQAKKYDVLSSPVDVDAGDEIQLYCSGTNIARPVMTVWLKRR